MKVATAVLALTVLLVAFAARAHHGPPGSATYYNQQIIELEGEITEVLWQNPHVRFRMAVVEDDGEATIWELESATPNMLKRAGISVDVAQPGDRVRAAGFVSKRDPNSIAMMHLLLPNGREFAAGNREPRWSGDLLPRFRPGDVITEIDATKAAAAAEAARGIFRVWTSPPLEQYARAIRNDESLTDRANQIQAAYDPVTQNPELDCRTGMPWTMFDPSVMALTEDGERIVLQIQEYDVERVIYMGAGSDAQNADVPASPLGSSVGHWEDDTLVVRTTAVDFPFFDLSGTPQSEQVEFVERFTMTANESRLNYTLTAIDPVMFTAPVVLERFWTWIPGVELESFECVLWND